MILEAAGRQVAPLFSRDGTSARLPSRRSTRRRGPGRVRAAGRGCRRLRCPVARHVHRVRRRTLVAVGRPDRRGGRRRRRPGDHDRRRRERQLDGARPRHARRAAGVPSLRPDQLAFRGQAPDGTWGMYLVRTDGGAPTHLDLDPGLRAGHETTGSTSSTTSSRRPGRRTARRLAYHTLEESTMDGDPGFRVRVADIDAAGVVTAETLLAPEPAIDDEFDAAWLPDGSGVVVHRVEENDSRGRSLADRRAARRRPARLSSSTSAELERPVRRPVRDRARRRPGPRLAAGHAGLPRPDGRPPGDDHRAGARRGRDLAADGARRRSRNAHSIGIGATLSAATATRRLRSRSPDDCRRFQAPAPRHRRGARPATGSSPSTRSSTRRGRTAPAS